MGVAYVLAQEGVAPETLYDAPGSAEYIRLQEAAAAAEAERQRIAAEEAARIAAEEQARLLAEKNYQLMLEEQERQRLAEFAAQEAIFIAAPEPQLASEPQPVMVIEPAIPFQDMPVAIPDNNATPVTTSQQPLPYIEPITVLYDEPVLTAEEIEAYRLKKLAEEQSLIPEVIPITPTLPTVEEAKPIDEALFIGADEFSNLTNQGITIPENYNVVVVPVNKEENPVVFEKLVTEIKNNPDTPPEITVLKTIDENNVLQNTNIMNEPSLPSVIIEPVVVPEEMKKEIINNIDVITMVQENPGITMAEAQFAVDNGNIKPMEKFIEPVPEGTELATGTPADLDYLNRNIDVANSVIKGDFINGLHHWLNYGKKEYESGADWAKKRFYNFDLNDVSSDKLSWLDRLTNYVYNIIYTK